MENHQTNAKDKSEDMLEDEFLRERLERWGKSSGRPSDPYTAMRLRKNKWVAGILSFFIPGTGQLYLGLMQRGLGIMMLFMLDVFAVIYFSLSQSIPLIVLFCLLSPIIYFYNIFDALQQTDRVNGYGGPLDYPDSNILFEATPHTARPRGKVKRGFTFGYLLIIAGIVLFLAAGRPGWLDHIFDFLSSTFGALLLIALGLLLFFKESMKK
ncbi:hypothetical protein SAMN02799630_05341 [Paenibacillus sp. UNCCL117]|uniref:hypothetical protein n=1 Tax=unclassified Paenibacillus TaxID=185978 RepID=UPI000884680E|nr:MULTISPECIES: hypothetical protein [unclassified Paenibacillus]SDE39926.1 hypothetical protein SAMN04488602_12710 [Paenibacillus sp. cl123]SFW65272.1 hypothetical protein SAMN02799630_05341 [Paenibacillus sp. UNCCL117]